MFMNKKQYKITFIDLFSGIGGFRLGMEKAGHICLGHCEIDKFAEKSYRMMHDIKKGEWYADDITKVSAEELPKADCWCFGFPCTDVSIAGKRQGLQGKRSGLFLKLSDFLKKQKKKINPNGCSLKMLEICCQAKKDLILQKYSLHWIRSGMMQNGRCWTVPISEYHSTEKGSILLDILEQKAEK